jgi:3-methylfumaryl-CoA hydratase
VPLPRRMWAGSQFEFHHPLRVGDIWRARRPSVTCRTVKDGRTGELVFVKVRHELHQRRADPALTEFHDIVYRDLRPAT